MHYLIDGHNLIARLSAISLDDPDDEAKLVIVLRRWAAADLRRRVTVYFDGGLPGGQDSHLSSVDVNVIFATIGSTADDRMKNHIMRLSNPSEFVLVSSDRAIMKAAVKKKLRTITAGAFAAQLEQAPAADSSASGNDSDKVDYPSLEEDEVAEWLEIFNQGEKE